MLIQEFFFKIKLHRWFTWGALSPLQAELPNMPSMNFQLNFWGWAGCWHLVWSVWAQGCGLCYCPTGLRHDLWWDTVGFSSLLSKSHGNTFMKKKSHMSLLKSLLGSSVFGVEIMSCTVFAPNSWRVSFQIGWA